MKVSTKTGNNIAPIPSHPIAKCNNGKHSKHPFFWTFEFVLIHAIYLDAVNHTEDKCLCKDQAQQTIMQIVVGLALEDSNSTNDGAWQDEGENL